MINDLRGIRHLGGLHLPLFDVDLDTTEGNHEQRPGVPAMVRIRLMGGASDPETAMIYDALIAGQYVIEGGYPCWQDSRCRHGPLVVMRCDDPLFPRATWTIAERYR